MLTVCTFKWKPPIRGAPEKFKAEHVNVLAAMVRRHYPHPHRFVCITDDPNGLDPSIEPLELWSDYSEMLSPHGPQYPSCYRRLKLFSRDIGELLGPRFVCLDIDTVVTRDLSPVWNRPEDIVLWGGTNPTTTYNGSMVLMTAGARPHVWEEFDSQRSPQLARRARQFGSDQGWISYRLGPDEAMWKTQDGVYSWNVHLRPKGGRLPADARITFFHGKRDDPWSEHPQRLAWVREHWQKD